MIKLKKIIKEMSLSEEIRILYCELTVDAGCFCIALYTGILDDMLLSQQGANIVFDGYLKLAKLLDDVLNIFQG